MRTRVELLRGFELEIPCEETEGRFVAVLYDADLGLLLKAETDSMELDAALSLLLSGRKMPLGEALREFERRLRKLEAALASMEVRVLPVLGVELYYDELMEHSRMEHIFRIAVAMARALQSPLEAVEGFFEKVRYEHIRGLILEETFALVVADCRGLRGLGSRDNENPQRGASQATR